MPLALCRQAWQADILALSPNRFEDAAEAFWGAGLVKAWLHPLPEPGSAAAWVLQPLD